LTQTYPRGASDVAGPFIEELAAALVRQGDRVTVLAPHAAGLAPRWEARGVEVRTFRYAPERAEVLGYGRSLEADLRPRAGAALVAPLYGLAAWRAVARELRRRPCDLVHAHWIVPNGVAAAMALPRERGAAGEVRGRSGAAGEVGGEQGTPGEARGGRDAAGGARGGRGAAEEVGGAATPRLVIGLHGSDVFMAERRGLRALARRALGKAQALTGCSPELVERVCALGFPEERARVIPYGVDSTRFAPVAGRRGVWRQRLGIPEDAPVLLALGRMVAKKGFGVLAAALPQLLEELPRLHVILAGGGDLLPELAARTARWRGRVHLPGSVGRDTLPDLYRAADLFVLPAIHDARGNVDGLPNVILEAMASGLPVVASGISGIPLAVADGGTGLLVPENDPAALAAALRRLLADGDTARRMGESGRRKVEAELTWEAVAGRHREAYELAMQR
jgi:glycosyltransferase involved in cell wall biosynthesis